MATSAMKRKAVMICYLEGRIVYELTLVQGQVLGKRQRFVLVTISTMNFEISKLSYIIKSLFLSYSFLLLFTDLLVLEFSQLGTWKGEALRQKGPGQWIKMYWLNYINLDNYKNSANLNFLITIYYDTISQVQIFQLNFLVSSLLLILSVFLQIFIKINLSNTLDSLPFLLWPNLIQYLSTIAAQIRFIFQKIYFSKRTKIIEPYMLLLTQNQFNFIIIFESYILFLNMQKKKQRRVNFRVNHCSSQDPEYPVTELLLQSPDAKGWQSKRFSAYPQIIILQLVEPTLLRQISFLSHQSKIASKIQIETKLQQSKDWKKLGYVSLTSNQNTNYQARQLRSANLNGIPSLLVKFTLRTNHVNSQNVFNQVGLISLSIYGDKMVQSNFNVPSNVTQAPGQKTGGTLEFDKQTMNKLKELQIRKKQAVDNEQFDLAKNIKQEIERIKNIGQTLILLEQKKQQAIKRQDYENAKIINDQMRKMRDQNQWGPQQSGKPSGNPAQFYKKQKNQNQYEEEQEQQSVSPMTNQQQRPKPMPQKGPVVIKKQQEVRNAPVQQRAPQKMNDTQDRPLNNGGYKAPQQGDMDERPLDLKGNKGPSEYENDEEERQGGNGDVQPLSKQILGECQHYFDIIDEEIFKCLYSKDHKNREAGVKMLSDKLGQRVQNRQSFIQAMLYAIKCVIDDRIASVLIGVLELFDSFMKKMKPGANSSNLEYAEYIMEKICDYLGHTNAKVVKISQSIYSNLPVYQLTSKDVCYTCLTMTYKRQKPPKIQAGRLKMIGKIVSEYQLGKNYAETINYVIKYVDDKNNDVRTAAINAIVAISSQMGYSALQPFLKNVRPQILKTIEEQMEGGEGDDRNHEEKPIKTKGAQGNSGSSKYKNQIETVQNQFIEVPKNKKAQMDDKHCNFCRKYDPRFAEQDFLDMHFVHSCPILTLCLECKQVIEISYLTNHMLSECENSKYYKKCPRCKEAVHQKIFKTHVEKKQCLTAKNLGAANRCPLCHLDIGPGADGWIEHLTEQGCQNNPRK